MSDRTYVWMSGVAVVVLITSVTIGSPLSVGDGSAIEQQQPGDSSFVVVDESLTVPELATNSTEVRVAAMIRNDGLNQRTEGVDFRLEGEGRDIVAHRNVTIAGNESQRVTFVLNTTGFELGDYIVGITTRDSSQFAELELSNNAELDFDDQETNGTTVEVDEAFLPRGGYVAIYAGGPSANLTPSNVIGVSNNLPPGFHEDVVVTLEDGPGATPEQNRLSRNQTLVAVAHQETMNDGTFGFVTTNGSADGPYLVNGAPVSEMAPVNVTDQP